MCEAGSQSGKQARGQAGSQARGARTESFRMRPPCLTGSGSRTSLSCTVMPCTGCGTWPEASCAACAAISAYSSARKESLNLPNDFAAVRGGERRAGAEERRIRGA